MRDVSAGGGWRFAFYGRTSSVGYQDREWSRHWQCQSAQDLIAGHGVITVQFFDVGYSRRLDWEHRPQAAALATAIADPQREFDAVVVGEYERAFYGDQLLRLAPMFDLHQVQLWLSEAHGPIDFDNPGHRALVMLLGAQSRREVLRARFRVTAAMRAQTREQGRYLGGRPPYGSRPAPPQLVAVQALDGTPFTQETHRPAKGMVGHVTGTRRTTPGPARTPLTERVLTGQQIWRAARRAELDGLSADCRRE
jgi:DNA invertase Pin-like site-specific DNA recombinase